MSETLGDIRQRAEAATEGPWDMKECHPCTNRGRLDVSVWANGGNMEVAGWCDDDEFTRADAEFIAHARTDVPRLLGALDAVLAIAQRLDGRATTNHATAKQRHQEGDRVNAAAYQALELAQMQAAQEIRAAVTDALEATK